MCGFVSIFNIAQGRSAEMRGESLSALDTVATETPSSRAMSFIVIIRFYRCSLMHYNSTPMVHHAKIAQTFRLCAITYY